MITETLVTKIEDCESNFDKLIPKAAELHEFTWCVKNQSTKFTKLLKGSECCRCSEFVLNEGVCDPL